MTVSSIFLRTEFVFWREHSVIEDIGDAVVIRTPANPYWRWGHLIVMQRPPRESDAERLRLLFEEKIKSFQGRPHRLIVWEGGPLENQAHTSFEGDGLHYSTAEVLTLKTAMEPATLKPGLRIEEIAAESHRWTELVALNIECFAPNANNPNYRLFAERMLEMQRELVRRGMARWYAAIEGGEIAGALGIFACDGLCRFQEVAVRPKFRRRGIASRLIFEASQRALVEHPNNTQVIVTDSDGEAIRVYTRIGFEHNSLSYALKEINN